MLTSESSGIWNVLVFAFGLLQADNIRMLVLEITLAALLQPRPQSTYVPTGDLQLVLAIDLEVLALPVSARGIQELFPASGFRGLFLLFSVTAALVIVSFGYGSSTDDHDDDGQRVTQEDEIPGKDTTIQHNAELERDSSRTEEKTPKQINFENSLFYSKSFPKSAAYLDLL